MNELLPTPSADAQASSRELCSRIAAHIENAGGWIPFVEFMDMALHLPGLGYYAGGSHKFGEQGDFVTAPELTPLFGQALAAQVAEVLAQVAMSPAPTSVSASASAVFPAVLEVGAGSGRLAADLLPALEALGTLPDKYLILELSGELRARQRETIRQAVPALADRVEWLEALPEKFSGCIVANELLDAIPTHAVAWRDEGAMERGVTYDGECFAWAERRAQGALREAMERLAAEAAIEAPYVGEIGLAASSWVAEWGQHLERGALLLLDYGLSRRELYHSGRNGGTLRCHYRHRAHDDPFWWPGLSDITSHIDFTAVAEAGYEAGLDVLGYTSQAGFLINCGLGELLAARQQTGDPAMVKAAGAVSVLLSPGEMGELFKVIALGRGVTEPLRGFARGDRTHAL